MINYALIPNVFDRADAIARNGLGNFGKDTPSGLVYHAGLYLTPNERADIIAHDMRMPYHAEDSLGLGLLND